MKSKLVADNAGERTYALVLDPGEEAFQTIGRFADEVPGMPDRRSVKTRPAAASAGWHRAPALIESLKQRILAVGVTIGRPRASGYTIDIAENAVDHAEAVLGVVESDTLDDAGQNLPGR
jgi:hypothetical protein